MATRQYSFTGHETFNCKQSWLKKGYDFHKAGHSFGEESAVVDLGIGKNMVTSIKFWLRAFGILVEEEKTSPLGEFLFGKQGVDPYLEDIGTLWLLHYSLIKVKRASIYHLLFNGFRRKYPEFEKGQFIQFIKNECALHSPTSFNQNTVEADLDVLLKNYLPPRREDKDDIEDGYARLFPELGLIQRYKAKENKRTVELFRTENSVRPSLPFEIVLFALLDTYPNSDSINFDEIQTGDDSPGQIFALNREDLFSKLEAITHSYKGKVTFADSAGIGNLQFLKSIDKFSVLKSYYEK